MPALPTQDNLVVSFAEWPVGRFSTMQLLASTGTFENQLWRVMITACFQTIACGLPSRRYAAAVNLIQGTFDIFLADRHGNAVQDLRLSWP